MNGSWKPAASGEETERVLNMQMNLGVGIKKSHETHSSFYEQGLSRLMLRFHLCADQLSCRKAMQKYAQAPVL